MTPDTSTIAEHHFKTVDRLHTLYVQEWGAKDGVPILFLHGGPGSGCSDKHKLNFDPKRHRVIFLDQRGAGHSTPKGSLENNTTSALVDDIEHIRHKLRIDSWVVYGNSWGSTLGLCYAIKHQENIQKLIIAGVWLSTTEEKNWLFNGGWRHTFPELWGEILSSTPSEYHVNPGDYHLSKTYSKNLKIKKKSLFILNKILYALISIDEKKQPLLIDTFDEESTKIEMHYVNNNDFIENSYILENAPNITLPVTIIQGRYDMVCPPVSAYRLYTALPNASLNIILSGHSITRGGSDALTQAFASL